MILASFIVPIYNSESYLSQCLDSILAQSVDDYEVILVDDGSRDASGAICDEYAQRDSRIKVIHKKNAGLSAARNDGLDVARGEWVTFVDSDDWLEPDFLEVLIKNQEVDYIVTSINHCCPDGFCEPEKFEGKRYNVIDEAVFEKKNMLTAFFTAWSKFFNAKIINDNRLRFVPDVSPGEDTIFVFQYLSHIHSICLSDSPCYNWRVANGLTNRKRSFKWIEYTIDHTMTAFEQVESKCNVELAEIKFHSLNYLIDKVDVSQYSFRQLYSEIKKIALKSWMKALATDHLYLRKGRRRKLIDFLIRSNAFYITSLFCKLWNRFY